MITNFKIYENIPNFRPEINLKVGDIWKGDFNNKNNKWWIVAKLDFITPNFWINTLNKISCLYIDLDADKVNYFMFNYFTSFTPESDMEFNTKTYNIQKLWNDNPKKLIEITEYLILSDNKHITKIWFKEVPELEIALETTKYNL